jgi:hypothetical protein
VIVRKDHWPSAPAFSPTQSRVLRYIIYVESSRHCYHLEGNDIHHPHRLSTTFTLSAFLISLRTAFTHTSQRHYRPPHSPPLRVFITTLKHFASACIHIAKHPILCRLRRSVISFGNRVRCDACRRYHTHTCPKPLV